MLPDLDRAGIYRLDLAKAAGTDAERKTQRETVYVAVNVDTGESDLTRINEDFLFASFPGAGIRYIQDLDEASTASTTSATASPSRNVGQTASPVSMAVRKSFASMITVSGVESVSPMLLVTVSSSS